MITQSVIDALRHTTIAPQSHFVNGKEYRGSGEPLKVINPALNQTFSEILSGSVADTEFAITAARQSFDDGRWRNMPPNARKKILHRFADLIEKHALDLAVQGSRENGTEISMAYHAEPLSALNTVRYYAECIDKVNGEIAPTQHDILGLIHRQPIGVVGAIIPWNFPLMIGAWKFAPALAMGNSVVLKPAETASLNLLKMAQLACEAGIPDGVFNVITGKGSVVGATIAQSMQVDVMAFTGSGSVGKQLLHYSANSNLKPCYLELGGKSPNIVFADADLTLAANKCVSAIFRNAGQVCVSGSRLFVQKSISQTFIERVKTETEKLLVGDPLNLKTQVGAIHSLNQQQNILNLLEHGLKQDAELISGGCLAAASEDGGNFIKPTLIKLTSNQHPLAQQEIFGPVLCIMEFDDEKQAVELANDTQYGLAAGVWTQNFSQAHRLVHAIEAGVVHVNTYGGPDITVPLGGMKQSGNGYDKSMHAIDKYSQLKTAWMQL